MAEPLATLSPSKQNARPPPRSPSFAKAPSSFPPNFDAFYSDSHLSAHPSRITDAQSMDTTDIASSPAAEYHTTSDFPSPRPISFPSNAHHTPSVTRSPVKYRLQDESLVGSSPPASPASPAGSTIRFNEGITRAIGDIVREASMDRPFYNNQDTSSISPLPNDDTTETDLSLGPDNTIVGDNTTVGDLSSISAIPTDLTRFASLRNSPPKHNTDGISPTRSYRNSMVAATPVTGQRPLHLLSRRSTSSNEDDEQTPRRPRDQSDSPTDLLNFTGQANIVIPPPSSAPRTTRRSPSGRGAFPIRVNPTPSHRSQASMDREKASGRSPNKQFPDAHVPATPSNHRHSVATPGQPGLGSDLLDIDFGPLATPRSIPTVTPRELETLRSELQSKISSLEATLSGKEAEVSALKRAVTDAEVRAGKTSEDLRTERSEKEEIQTRASDLERRAREMEDVLREVKQNAFVEEREREKLRKQAEEAERRTEECEVKILELNASLDTLRSDKLRSPIKFSANEPATPGGSLDIDAAVKNATETVARELHALYKSKHERKVADLKLSYEKRWIKQVDQLKQELKQSQDEISRLLVEKDGFMSGVIPGQSEALSKMEGQIEELRRYNDDVNAQKKVVEAEAAGVRSQLDAVKRENEELRVEVEQERVEKGDLVAQVDMFLSLSAEQESERERERQEREARERERQPVSPPRSDASSDSNGQPSTAAQVQSPHKARPSLSAGRPRPMSMLVKPTAGKFGSGIPGPGTTNLKAPTAVGSRTGAYGRSNLMDGIARMGGR